MPQTGQVLGGGVPIDGFFICTADVQEKWKNLLDLMDAIND